MIVEIVTDITTEPVTLTEVKNALRITGTGHDDELNLLISDARKFIERAINTSVLERDLKVTCDIELDEFELPFGPIIGDVTETEDDDDNYVYEYSAGYTDTPADVKRLILLQIKKLYDIDDVSPAVDGEIKKLIQATTRQPAL